MKYETYKKLAPAALGKVNYNNLNPVVSGLVLAPEHLRMQRASGVALLAWEQAQAGESPSGLSVTPNYLRLSQAERERQKKILSE